MCVSSCQQNQNKPLIRSVRTTYPVKIEPVTERTLPGIVKENQIINLGFKAAGQIIQIYVKEGDYVKEGQLLAKLDDKDYRLQLSATEIQYNQLKTEVERLEELYKRNSIAGNDYEKAVAGLNALKVQLQAYQNQVDYTLLEAPSSGYIQSVNFRKSEMVDAGRPVFTLMDMSSIVVETDLPANLYLQKSNFGDINCNASLLPGQSFPLKILSISHKSNGNQLYKMYLTVINSADNPLTAGMNVEVSIKIVKDGETPKGYILPVNCVFSENDKQYVWVLLQEQSIVQKKEVQVVGVDDGNIVITGIEPGNEIISAGVQYLKENEKVNVISGISKTNVGGLL
jgi:RND family efflux transporter MFP subunit